MNGMSTSYPQANETFLISGDTGAQWRCPVGFIEDVAKLIQGMDNQSEIERETQIPQPALSRMKKEFGEGGKRNPTLKNLAPIIDYFGLKLVNPKRQLHESESDLRDKIANEVMKALLQCGREDVAGTVFALITKTPIARGGEVDRKHRAAGNG